MPDPTIITSQDQLDALCASGPGPHHIDTQGRWYVIRGSSHVEARDSSIVEAYDSSSVAARGSSIVVAYDSNSVAARGSSRVDAFDSSRVILCGQPWVGPRIPGVPMIPDLDRRTLAAIEAPGCGLRMAQWHTCDTTHCRAGWYITLAGDAGAALEREYGPVIAGAAIWDAAHPGEPIPDWFASDAAALADIRRSADREPAHA